MVPHGGPDDHSGDVATTATPLHAGYLRGAGRAAADDPSQGQELQALPGGGPITPPGELDPPISTTYSLGLIRIPVKWLSTATKLPAS